MILTLISPTSHARLTLIKNSQNQFKKSDESAYSIVPSRLSMSTRAIDEGQSLISEDDIVYQRLSFEDDLFTARVYKRNYRNPLLLAMLKKPFRTESKSIPLDRSETRSATTQTPSNLGKRSESTTSLREQKPRP